MIIFLTNIRLLPNVNNNFCVFIYFIYTYINTQKIKFKYKICFSLTIGLLLYSNNLEIMLISLFIYAK